MSLSQGARNKIKSFVQAAKKVLMSEFETQLQQFYGIRPNGTCLLVEELTSRDASVIETARLLRQRLHYLESTIAGENKAPEAVRQLVREQAFTILNRFAALRMSEERNIIRESIRNGYNSEGFLVYDQLTGGAKTADQFTRYKWYVGHVFDELAIDLPAVFDRFSPYALLFPSERVLLDLLTIINDEELILYRETGHQLINLWSEDETIGWIYQYYNSREEISEMREASDAPRNSRELAVRNQFFTPRYVVQFLVDNSLGRQWYEMTKGQTVLKDLCQYMVKQSLEIFLEMGESIPETKVDGANYVEFRPLKDPREILFLDPACGSMHFGLYGFDLFEQIYIEAWDHHPTLLRDMRDQYLREEFIKEIPGFILRYNIHGVDIDPRAIQIAGLSLWLRAQKSFDVLNLHPTDRPSISKSNLVIAEPLPGDKHLLSEFSKSLPGPIGKLVRIIWDKMQLAGETGLLLKIEEELKKEIEIARQEYERFKNSTTQASLFGSKEEHRVAEMAAIYGKGQKISKDFFDTAEEEVLKALQSFAENAEGEDAFQKLLFAEDTARGFAFIELCRKRYDVAITNPPFGLGLKRNFDWLKRIYPNSFNDLLACFIDRLEEMANGHIGAITSRNILLTPRLQKIREVLLIPKMDLLLDLGWPVMDEATVQSAAYLINKTSNSNKLIAIDRKSSTDKDDGLIHLIKSLNERATYVVDKNTFKSCPRGKILYNLPAKVLNIFGDEEKFGLLVGYCKQGMKTFDDTRFVRLWAEVNPSKIGKGKKFRSFSKGGEYSMYYTDLPVVLNYEFDGAEVQEVNRINNGQTAQARQASSFYYRNGGNFSRRCKDFGVRILPYDFVLGEKGPGIFINKGKSILYLLGTIGLLNSRFYKLLVNLQANANQYDTGIIESLPIPKGVEKEFEKIGKPVEEIISEIKKIYTFFEESPLFMSILVGSDFKSILNKINLSVSELNDTIDQRQSSIDLLLQNSLGLDFDVILKEFATSDDNEHQLSLEKYRPFEFFHERECASRIISYFIGFVFDRWISRKDSQNEFLDTENIFRNPTGESINYKQKHDLYFSESSSNNNNEFSDKISSLIVDQLSESSLQDIELSIGCNLKAFLLDYKKFFDFHLSQYTISRRVAPIYWPISTKSNTYNIWVYYLSLNENTLFSIVNDLVDPKIKEVSREFEVLKIRGQLKELATTKEFLEELQDLRYELNRLAPIYKPNQDDGVLITAAPLHNLFRHPKWKKETQECWEKLEKGEYDWAHIAYSIWPDRVRKKCKKDLSMAIAHGLEDICDVKPKEKKDKKPKDTKPASQLKLD